VFLPPPEHPGSVLAAMAAVVVVRKWRRCIMASAHEKS
jgi:hypothetical protein